MQSRVYILEYQSNRKEDTAICILHDFHVHWKEPLFNTNIDGFQCDRHLIVGRMRHRNRIQLDQATHFRT